MAENSFENDEELTRRLQFEEYLDLGENRQNNSSPGSVRVIPILADAYFYSGSPFPSGGESSFSEEQDVPDVFQRFNTLLSHLSQVLNDVNVPISFHGNPANLPDVEVPGEVPQEGSVASQNPLLALRLMAGNNLSYEELCLLDELNAPVRRGLSQDYLDQLPRETYTKELTDVISCPICLSEFTNGDVLIRIPCSHVYHGDCILTWLKTNATCPVCRKELKSSSLSNS